MKAIKLSFSVSYQLLTPSVLIGRLINAHQHLIALRISEYLGINQVSYDVVSVISILHLTFSCKLKRANLLVNLFHPSQVCVLYVTTVYNYTIFLFFSHVSNLSCVYSLLFFELNDIFSFFHLHHVQELIGACRVYSSAVYWIFSALTFLC